MSGGLWSGLADGLVVAAGIEGECSEQFTVGGHDPHVEVGDQEQDADPGVASADADVVQAAVVAQGDHAAAVDRVVADAAVAWGGVAWRCGSGLGSLGVGGSWGVSGEGAVGSLGVVVAGELVELELQVGHGCRGGLLGEPAFEGLVEALDLAGSVGGRDGRCAG
jgi:hypothetical protein